MMPTAAAGNVSTLGILVVRTSMTTQTTMKTNSMIWLTRSSDILMNAPLIAGVVKEQSSTARPCAPDNYAKATISISTLALSGNLATCTVERAGLWVGKNSA